jgi:hypothetical protein
MMMLYRSNIAFLVQLQQKQISIFLNAPELPITVHIVTVTKPRNRRACSQARDSSDQYPVQISVIFGNIGEHFLLPYKE